jgi:pimeloyl-ACP methyl ester carboxylesterase
MPDLRGHGLSPRGDYAPQLWADDLVDSLPRGADLAIGHSLGGMALSLAVSALEPSRAVFVDPAWKMIPEQHRRYAADLKAQLGWNASRLSEEQPRWADEDIAARIASMSRFDARCIDGFCTGAGHDYVPRSLSTRSLIVLADPSELVPPNDAASLEKAGFDVAVVPGSGHSIFRDDLQGFLNTLDAWLDAAS